MNPAHRLVFALGMRVSSVPLLHGRAPLITAIIASAPIIDMARAMPAVMTVCHRGAAVWLLQGHTRGRGTCGVSCVPSVCSSSTVCSESGDQNLN